MSQELKEVLVRCNQQYAAAQEMYELLKDIVNAIDDGQPYFDEELFRIIGPVLEQAYQVGIKGRGEE